MKNKIGYLSLLFYLLIEGSLPILSFFVMEKMEVLWVVTLAILVSLIFLFFVFLNKKLYKQYYKKEILLPSLFSAIGLGGGTLLYFFGINYLNPSIASILLLLITLFGFIAFNILGKEEYTYQQLIGSVLMIIGGTIIMYDGGNFISIGSIIMIISCILFAFGNFYTKKASLNGASSFFILFNRNILTVIFTFILAYYFHGFPEIKLVEQNILGIIAIGFLFLFVAKILWILALKNLDSIIPISSFPLIAVFTIFFSYLFIGEALTLKQWVGFFPIIIGTFLLTYFKPLNK